MPGPRGWGLTAASLLLGVAGLSLAVPELLVVAVGGVALVATATAYVRLTRVKVEVRRALHPPRVYAGDAVDVEIKVGNTGTRPSPLLGAVDPFDHGRRRARFQVAPLPPGQEVQAAYQLRVERRGVYDLGPLDVRIDDPFGLASRSVGRAPATRLVVYPRIEVVGPLLPGPADRRQERAGPSPAPAGTDGDLYALREYQSGDDVRRVHWRSTAKRDELMIRHPETPGQGAATVLLDLRGAVHSDETLEAAVSAAASIVHAAWRRRWPVRLVTSDGTDSGLGAGRPHMETLLERLAVAGVHGGASPATLVVPPPPPGGRGGMLAAVTTAAASQADLRSVTGGRHRRYSSVLVLVEAGGDGAQPHQGSAQGLPGAVVVRVGAGRELPAAWAAAMAPGRARRAVVG